MLKVNLAKTKFIAISMYVNPGSTISKLFKNDGIEELESNRTLRGNQVKILNERNQQQDENHLPLMYILSELLY